jgi:hypothetical protein
MEEPLHRLTGAAVLFSDITTESSAAPELRMRGLSFLAEAMFREALRLFRLYHGHPPRYLSGRRRGAVSVSLRVRPCLGCARHTDPRFGSRYADAELKSRKHSAGR